MIFEMVVPFVATLLFLHQNRVLQRLSLTADETLADRAIEAGRLKSAETRITLFDRESRNMCLTPACHNPVIGKWIFAHCEQHLERYEKVWLDDKLESREAGNLPTYSEHPIVKQAQEAVEARDKELIHQNAANKIEALAQARDRVSKARSHKLERTMYVPRKLQARIEEAEKEQQKAVDGNWVPLNLMEWIHQKSEKDK